jgi:hypothetical protein
VTIPEPVTRLYLVCGWPDYLFIEGLFSLPALEAKTDNRLLTLLEPKSTQNGWEVGELDIDSGPGGKQLTVSITNNLEKPAVACFRILGF